MTHNGYVITYYQEEEKKLIDEETNDHLEKKKKGRHIYMHDQFSLDFTF